MKALDILLDRGFDYETISSIVHIGIPDILDYENARNRALEDIEHFYRTVEHPRVQKDIQEWIQEIPREDWEPARREYLEREIEETKREFLDACVAYAKRIEKRRGKFQRERIEALERKLFRLGFDVKVHVGKEQGLTQEMIERAREFPITNFVKSRNGMASCPFHTDKTPSMDIRKNFYHCYSCGENGDVIDLVMKLQGITFKRAIEQLYT